MAAWIVHLRIAEKLFARLGIKNAADYYVGSVAPDSGRMVGPFEYLPPKDVSHWKRDRISDEERLAINDEFAFKFLKDETDPEKRDLFTGYYVHILTDTFFTRDVIRPYVMKYGRDEWHRNIGSIRANWYDIDFRFVAEHPDFYPLEVLGKVKDYPNVYFDYFTKDDITERVTYIYGLYKNSRPGENVPFISVTPDSISRFVDKVSDEIFDRVTRVIPAFKEVTV
ncbi:MAG: hypothetical protein J5793_04845 [Clostridia bacterium]|nr:hypothetical protein [Clostridia bacterium]